MGIKYRGTRKPGWQEGLFEQGCRKLNELKVDGGWWQLLSPKAKERYISLLHRKSRRLRLLTSVLYDALLHSPRRVPSQTTFGGNKLMNIGDRVLVSGVVVAVENGVVTFAPTPPFDPASDVAPDPASDVLNCDVPSDCVVADPAYDE